MADIQSIVTDRAVVGTVTRRRRLDAARIAISVLTAPVLLALPLLAVAGPAQAGGATPPTPPPPMGAFNHPTRVDNPLFPLVPGTEWTYTGTVTDADGSVPHEIVFTVSSLTKVVGGVRTRVVWDRDLADGVLQEAELALFAQDDAGTVWNMAEYPEEYDAGRLTGAPDTWVNGLAGARGGIHMLARPRPGATYTEGLIPRIDFYDVSTVAGTNVTACSDLQCYDHVLLVDETSPLDPTSGTQTKYYAPGVGLVRIGAIGGDSRERERLSRLRHLGSAELQAVDRAVMQMDQRGHHVSAVWSRTAPVQ